MSEEHNVNVNIVTPQVSSGPVTYTYAGFWMRVVAYFIDYIIIVVPSWIFSIIYFAVLFGMSGVHSSLATYDAYGDVVSGSTTSSFDYPGIFLLGILVYIVLVVGAVILYNTLLESSKWQGTIGKKVLGIIVTDEQGKRISFMRAFGRNLGKVLSGLIFYIGFIMVGFTEKKQGLHDIMAHTLVLRKS